MLWCDLETRSEADLSEVGLFRYADDPSTRILMMAYAFDNGPVDIWEPHRQAMPGMLRDAFSDCFIQKAAWNVQFERRIIYKLLGIETTADEWYDPMIHARMLSMPGKLDMVSKILRLDEGDEGKLATGKKLIRLFSQPTIEAYPDSGQTLFGAAPARFHDWRTKPQEWEQFKQYCCSDVLAERAAAEKMKPFPIPHRLIQEWVMDQRINERGLPVDRELVESAVKVVEEEQARLTTQLKDLTGLANPNSTAQIQAWLQPHGYSFTSMNKTLVTRAQAGECELSDLGQSALVLRQQSAKASVKKLYSIRDTTSEDGRMRGLFAFGGASRTMRWCIAEGSSVLTLTDCGLAENKPIEKVLLSDRVWDGEGWVEHEGVVFSGYREVIEWDGVRATPTHEVWISDTEKAPLAEAKECGLPIWRGKLPHSKGPFRYSSAFIPIRTRTYDIINAGPKNRFQVNGRIVSNSGSGAQPHNFPRPQKAVEKQFDLALDLLRKADVEGLRSEFGSVLDVVLSCLRAMIKAPDGYRLVVADLASIEVRVLGWVTGCSGILDVFAKGLEPYIDFASTLFRKPYSQVTKEERQIAKPPLLGCFSSATRVLTQRGWVSIIEVTLNDRLWDGQEWVAHEGVLYQGPKEVIDLWGVEITPDHEILTKQGWIKACEVMLNGRYETLAIDLGSGLYSGVFAAVPEEVLNTYAIASPAGRPWLSVAAIWKKVAVYLACRALTPVSVRLRDLCTRCIRPTLGSFWIVWRTAITRYCRGAEVTAPPPTGTAVGVSNAASRTCTSSLDIACLYLARRIQRFSWIDKIMMGTTNPATSVSSPRRSTTETSQESSMPSPTTDKQCAPKISGTRTLLGIAALLRSAVSFVKGCLPNRSSQIKSTAEVPTYDILNAGPRNRFMILTDKGPLIAHNCGYALGPGEITKDAQGNQVLTGLLNYAAAMGVTFTPAEATRAVTLFRKKFPEVPAFWREITDAAVNTVSSGKPTGVGQYLYFDMHHNVLRLHLPSGRCLHYLRPTIQEEARISKRTGNPYTATFVTFEGMGRVKKVWTRLNGTSSLFTENVCQAIARDVLANGLLCAEQVGFEVVGHVHDETIAMVRDDSPLTYRDLEEAMSKGLQWAPGLPLAAAGFETIHYKKE